jgi:post-segregation antitoxin (ccd killing protein)
VVTYIFQSKIHARPKEWLSVSFQVLTPILTVLGCGVMKTKGRRAQVQLTLPPELVEKAREYGSDISRITEQALLSILDYSETQNMETSSEFLSSGSSPKKVQWTGRDLNPRPPRCQRGDHSKLIYPPKHTQTEMQDNINL